MKMKDFLCRVRQAFACPLKTRQEIKENMDIVCSSSSKKIAGDTRNNLVTMMFVTHNRYNCFRKQIYIDTCIQAFHDLGCFGFEFGDFRFAMDHVHFLVNIPKRHSVQIDYISHIEHRGNF